MNLQSIPQPEPQHHNRCIAPTYRGTRCRRQAGSFGNVCTTHGRLIYQHPNRYDSDLVESVRRARRRWMERHRRRMESRRANRIGRFNLPHDRPVVVLVPVAVWGGAA